jgi:hypothetical protein
VAAEQKGVVEEFNPLGWVCRLPAHLHQGDKIGHQQQSHRGRTGTTGPHKLAQVTPGCIVVPFLTSCRGHVEGAGYGSAVRIGPR